MIKLFNGKTRHKLMMVSSVVNFSFAVYIIFFVMKVVIIEFIHVFFIKLFFASLYVYFKMKIEKKNHFRK